MRAEIVKEDNYAENVRSQKYEAMLRLTMIWRSETKQITACKGGNAGNNFQLKKTGGHVREYHK